MNRFDLLFVASYLYFFSFANLTLISECRIMQLQLLSRQNNYLMDQQIIGNGLSLVKGYVTLHAIFLILLCASSNFCSVHNHSDLLFCNQFSKVPPFVCLICVDSTASYHLIFTHSPNPTIRSMSAPCSSVRLSS